MTAALTLRTLRRYAVARTLFAPTTLQRAIGQLGFVQADPIRAPARAQDLVLRHRARNYRAGDLERRYPALAIEEDFFVNYGFLPREHHALMHPRIARTAWSPVAKGRAAAVLEFVRAQGLAHPREVDARFAHGRRANGWGGSSNATTHLLDQMHYRGLLRVARRDAGIRVYAVREPGTPDARSPAEMLDVLIDIVVHKYAPVAGSTLTSLVRRLRYGAPQWRRGLPAALARAKMRLRHARVGGIDWYWPPAEEPLSFRDAVDDEVRVLAPFDPIVWDRTRFEVLWGWAYRFEAYTPLKQRRFGHYALPLLHGDKVVGWANMAVKDGVLQGKFGYAGAKSSTAGFRRGLDAELDRMNTFLRL
jgi:uncharacterized protein YcaQ